MECLKKKIFDVKNPWNERMHSLMFGHLQGEIESVGSLISSFGLVTDVIGKSFTFQLGVLEPYQGVALKQPVDLIQATCSANFDPPMVNRWIGFRHAKVTCLEPKTLWFDMDASIWEISEHDPNTWPDFCHLFAGGFGGWGKAVHWHFPRSKNFAIDHDPDVMSLWQLSNESRVVQDAHGCPHYKDWSVGILMDVGDEWYGLIRHTYNLFMTMSPPCISWSLGGKMDGLACYAGHSFWQAICAVKWVRPIAVTLECVDRICAHKHFAIIQEAARFCGYRIHWSQTVKCDTLVGMNRTRWLAVWIRNDVQSQVCHGSFKLSDVYRKGWNDEVFQFHVPEQIAHELVLTPKLLSIYGNPQFLPSGLKGDDNPITQEQVLSRRCIRDDQNLPTLCANYSKQHALNMKHIQDRGIFAPLMNRSGMYTFIDPMRFVALLGAPKNTVMILPTKLDICFHVLGNSIAVPHALLCLRIALANCGFDELPITSTVLSCWQDRMTPNDVVVLRNKDFMFMTPHAKAQDVILQHCFYEDTKHAIQCCSVGLMKTATFDEGEILQDVLRKIGIEASSQQGICIKHHDKIIPMNTKIQHVVNCPMQILVKSFSMIELRFISTSLSIPPTVISDSDADESDLEVLAFVQKLETTEPPEMHVVPFTVMRAASCHAETVYWPPDLSKSQISLRLSFMFNLPDSRRVIPWYQAQEPQSDAPPIVIADVHNECNDNMVAVVIIDQQGKILMCKIVDANILPINLVLGEFPNTVAIEVNGINVELTRSHRFKSGDHVRIFQAASSQSISNEDRCTTGLQFQTRIEELTKYGPQAGSDEITFATSIFKSFAGNVLLRSSQ